MSVEFPKIDDEQLQRMAAAPPRPLFAVFEHAGAMVPWVVLMACLPALFAVTYRPLTDTNAAWGLKALKMSSAPTVGEFVAPGAQDTSVPFRWQPPLISWLAAAAVDLFGAWSPSALLVATLLATAGFLVAVYVLALRIGDEKLGLLTVCLLTFHVEVLTASQATSPTSAAVCFAVLTIWAFLGHVHKAHSTLSANLLVGGISLGLCLLAGGVLALVVSLVLAMHAVGLKVPLRRAANLPPLPRGQAINRGPILRSLGVMLLTAFAVGGWWELMMGYSAGKPFWRAWFTGDPGYTIIIQPIHGHSPFIVPRDMSELMLVLAGPILYGLWRAIREIRTGEYPRRCRDLQLLIIWTIVAGACWQLARSYQFTAAASEELWKTFLLVPLMMLAGWGILRILNGRAQSRAVALVGLITAVNLIWHAPSHLARTGLMTTLIMIVLIGMLALIASWGADRHTVAQAERRESRLLVSTFIILLIIGHCLAGIRALPRAGERDRELARLRQAMSKIEQPVTHFTIVAPESAQAAPIQLEYLARAIWPSAEGKVYTSWDDVPNWTNVGTGENEIPISKATPAHVYFLWKTPPIPFAAAGGHSEITRFQEYFRQQQVSVLVRPATAL